ncbi:MAG: (2Fe-2S)-binding protein [endosymbiont of Galathealinum brachiosum]|uniref:(2Fe-2S)-binding protein n=1 Tax=endosymbiont of Galathealinum brachiosum TaxID=2200906 RepID=A0A370DBZ9_9GAMM|nr:MAG: (2Fe-2S)-binding protein [endosymbiont of Galathealinum brachiosum]
MLEQLCHIDEINDPGAKGFNLKQGRKERLLFIIKKEGQIYAYENQCPHAGINLEWQEDDFLDNEKNHIQCSVHGALFNIKNGDCMGGPCNGEGLTSAEVEVDNNGNVMLLA